MQRSTLYLWLSALCCIIISGTLQAQQTDSTSFDLDSYQHFLRNHQNLSYDGLRRMHEMGNYVQQVTPTFSDAKYADSILHYYPLNDNEINKLNQHNFMVTDRIRYKSFGKAFKTIFKRDLPVYLSSDAILHALHMSYNNMLKTVETEAILPALKKVLRGMHDQIATLNNKYISKDGMAKSLRDADVFLTVPMKLLGMDAEPYYQQNQSRVDTLLDMIHSEDFHDYPIFSNTPRRLDFSQFKPRGHYTSSKKLKRYFRAMMWLGRMELYLKPPESKRYNNLPDSVRFALGQRQTIDAYLLREALLLADQKSRLQQIDQLLTFFVGHSDNVTFSNLTTLKNAVTWDNPASLRDSLTYALLKQELRQRPALGQRILSQVLIHDPMSPDSIKPATAFMMTGQRFVIDSYIMGKLVYDRIDAARLLPKGADVLYTLGNNQALKVLKKEIEKYNYATELAALRHLVEQYGSDFWKETIFNMWLQGIRALNPPKPEKVDSLPSFMQTDGWIRKTMNTQLASWAQLRHDNLLYAKQSYTGGFICSYPKVLVEPNPDFFGAMKILGNETARRIQNMSILSQDTKETIKSHFTRFAEINSKLKNIAAKELSGKTITKSEEQWLKKLAFESNTCGVELTGWYKDLFWNGDDGATKFDMVVADVHTAPTNRAGNMVGYVMHAGTGPLNLAVISTEMPDGKTYAFVGPVMSYYTHVTTDFERLTDAEWKETAFKQDATTRPIWTDTYMAKAGDPYYDEIGIGVDIPEPRSSKETPNKVQLFGNFPNPFNASTIINFQIPPRMDEKKVQLSILTVNGREVTTLINRSMPAGSYTVRWNANTYSSGVYLYKLEVGNTKHVRKMTLLK